MLACCDFSKHDYTFVPQSISCNRSRLTQFIVKSGLFGLQIWLEMLIRNVSVYRCIELSWVELNWLSSIVSFVWIKKCVSGARFRPHDQRISLNTTIIRSSNWILCLGFPCGSLTFATAHAYALQYLYQTHSKLMKYFLFFLCVCVHFDGVFFFFLLLVLSLFFFFFNEPSIFLTVPWIHRLRQTCSTMIYNYFERIDCIRCNRGNENHDYRWHSHERALFKLTGTLSTRYLHIWWCSKQQFAWASSKLLGRCVFCVNLSQVERTNICFFFYIFLLIATLSFLFSNQIIAENHFCTTNFIDWFMFSSKLYSYSYWHDCICSQMGNRFGNRSIDQIDS